MWISLHTDRGEGEGTHFSGGGQLSEDMVLLISLMEAVISVKSSVCRGCGSCQDWLVLAFVEEVGRV